jgi:hypothetical protein
MTIKNAPQQKPFQVTSHHSMTVITSPRHQVLQKDNKRKIGDPEILQHINQLSVGGSRLFVCKDQDQGATFAKSATMVLNALTDELSDVPDSLLGNQSVVEFNSEKNVGARALHVNKKSKLTRVASMPRLFSGLEGGQSSVSTVMPTTARLELINRLNFSVSAPSLPALADKEQPKPATLTRFSTTNPEKHLFAVLKSEGITPVQTVSSLEIKSYFLEMTDDNIAAYGTDIISAVRQRDVPTLRRMHQEGRILQCCNRFGESILHMACRRGHLDIVRFLVDEGGVSFRVCDDYGRTPLHDACWTREPEIELVKMLVTACPDLLLFKDKRGFTPLAYVRRDHWGQWCEFLEENRELLRPNELLSRVKQQ